MFWGKNEKKYNKKKHEKKHNKEKKGKKRRSKKRGEKHCSGKALLQSTMLCVRSYSVFPTPFTIHIV